eukprot:gene5375-7453_t
MSKLDSSFSILSHKILDTSECTGILYSNKRNTSRENPIISAQKKSNLYDNKSPLQYEEMPIVKPLTMGKGWFNIEPLKMTESLQRDIKMIEMRNYMDPKRFYKNPDKIKHILHVGTVIEGPSEYKSSRLTNKERKGSIVEEILADKSLRDYSKRKYNEIQTQNMKKLRYSNKKKSAKKIK